MLSDQRGDLGRIAADDGDRHLGEDPSARLGAHPGGSGTHRVEDHRGTMPVGGAARQHHGIHPLR
jgi:hypothetical protein